MAKGDSSKSNSAGGMSGGLNSGSQTEKNFGQFRPNMGGANYGMNQSMGMGGSMMGMQPSMSMQPGNQMMQGNTANYGIGSPVPMIQQQPMESMMQQMPMMQDQAYAPQMDINQLLQLLGQQPMRRMM